MTTLKYTFTAYQSSCKNRNSHSTELSNAPFTRNWHAQAKASNSSCRSHTTLRASFCPQKQHSSRPRWSYAACAWIIHWHSSPDRLVHAAPWEGAAHTASSLRLTARTGEVLYRPRLTLFSRTILLLSANHDPMTYRPNINNSGSISPVPLEI